MGIKDRLTELGEAPRRHCTVSLFDGNELLIDCCGGVMGFTEGCEGADGEILLKIPCGSADRLMRISGGGLTLESFGPDGVRIIGSIEAVSFVTL